MMKYLILALYAAMLVAIATYASRKSKTLNDFFLGGRNIGGWMSAFAYGTSYFSAVIFVGYAGKIGWAFGPSAVLVGLGNALIGSLLAWLVLGRKTHQMTREMGASTMPGFFEKRYGSRNMKILAAVLIFLFLVPYSASVYSGLSYIFEESFGIPFNYAVLGIAVLTGLYLVVGGYLSTALTDFFQGVLMLGGVAMVVVFVLRSPEVGGITQGIRNLAAIEPQLTQVGGLGGKLSLFWLVMLTSLGVWGLPQMVHKYYGIRNVSAIRRGTIISTVFALVVGGGAYFIGVFGRLFLEGVPLDPVSGAANFDMIVPQMLEKVLASQDALMGFVIVLVLSASISTLSSLVLVSSSAVSMDLAQGVFFPKMGQDKTKLLMRIVCGVFILLSVLLAIRKFTTIITLMAMSWGTLSGAFLGPFLWGLWMKKANRWGAWVGMVGGLTVSIVLNLTLGAANSPMAGCLAMATSLVLTPVVSLLTQPKAKAESPQAAQAVAAE